MDLACTRTDVDVPLNHKAGHGVSEQVWSDVCIRTRGLRPKNRSGALRYDLVAFQPIEGNGGRV